MGLEIVMVGLLGSALTLLWLRNAISKEREERTQAADRRWHEWELDEEFRALESAELLEALKADLAESERKRRAV